VSGRIEVVVSSDWPYKVVELWSSIRPRIVVIPGGSTPRRLFQALVENASSLELDRCEFLLSDERCVPSTHRDSNFGQAYRYLGSRIRATFHRMRSETCDPAPYEAVLERRSIDLAILGLGRDGHTASIFSGSQALEAVGEGSPLVMAVEGPPEGEGPSWRRLTLTPAALSRAKVVAFIAEGAEKRAATTALVRGDGIPASSIEGRVSTFLFCDPEAAPEADDRLMP
jgi:6-phosphogluconolactonase